jgi:hypothetical protein
MRPELPEFADLLSRRPPPVAALARQVRESALRAMPDLAERFYPGWQALGLRHPVGGLLATIFPRDSDVVVYLEHGASLNDPYGLLGGQERLRQTRTLSFRPATRSPTMANFVDYLDLVLDHAVPGGHR